MKAHLLSRGLVHPEWYNFYYDDEVATFLLYNLSGQLTGYHNYRPGADKTKKNNPREGRYYTRGCGVFGMETWSLTGPLFLVEGIWDAIPIHNMGQSAIATLSNDPKHLLPWLRASSRLTIAICDNDAAGKKLAKLAHIAYTVRGSKDVGDMTFEEQYDMLCEIRSMANKLGYYGTKYGVKF